MLKRPDAAAVRLPVPLRRAWQARSRNEFVALVALVGAALGFGAPGGILGIGAVQAGTLALEAAGVILVYRSDRFLNFAQVQVGALAGTLFAVLTNGGAMIRGFSAICPPCAGHITPTLTDTDYAIAAIVAIALAVVVNYLFYRLVVRRFASAPRLMVTVASIFSITLFAAGQQLIVERLTTTTQQTFGGVTNAVPPPLSLTLRLAGALFHSQDVLTILVAALALAATGAYLRFSPTGVTIRATAENRARAQTLGIDANAVNSRVWLLAGLLAGFAGVLTVMSAPAADGTQVTSATTLVPVFAVVVLARLTSLPLAVVAALALSLLDQAMLYALGTSVPLQGALVVIIAALLLLQRPDRARTDADLDAGWRTTREVRPTPAVLRALPAVRRYRRYGGLAAVVILGSLPFFTSPGQTTILASTAVYAIVGMSLLILTGWAGQVSLGQFAFAAVGAYVAAFSHLPLPVGLIVGGLAGALTAVLVGLPAIKLRGLHLAIATLALALSVTAVLVNPTYLGSHLPSTLASPSFLGVNLADPRSFYFFALAALALVVTAVAGLRRSRFARVLIAARDNEVATSAIGVDVARARLAAFAVSGFLAAFAGVLFAFLQGGVRSDSFNVDASVTLFTFTVIGGLGALSGPLLGFVAFAVLTLSATSPGVRNLVDGGGGLLLLLLVPGGLARIAFDTRDAVLRRIAGRYHLAVPELDIASTAEAAAPAPILPKRARGGATAFVPSRYALDYQWALTAEPETLSQAPSG